MLGTNIGKWFIKLSKTEQSTSAGRDVNFVFGRYLVLLTHRLYFVANTRIYIKNKERANYTVDHFTALPLLPQHHPL
jgi:hypothetical protein